MDKLDTVVPIALTASSIGCCAATLAIAIELAAIIFKLI